jgi:hypothetical protein
MKSRDDQGPALPVGISPYSFRMEGAIQGAYGSEGTGETLQGHGVGRTVEHERKARKEDLRRRARRAENRSPRVEEQARLLFSPYT